jgi:hypothetical protein
MVFSIHFSSTYLILLSFSCFPQSKAQMHPSPPLSPNPQIPNIPNPQPQIPFVPFGIEIPIFCRSEGDHSRIARAIRLLRHGVVSKAGQALESKGLGDLDNPEIWEQLRRKHPERKQYISEDAFVVQPEEEVELKVEKILPKLDMNAAP